MENNLKLETNLERQKTGMIIDRPMSNPLSDSEIQNYENDGWKFSYIEPRITFIPTVACDISGPTCRYIFWKEDR